ncbi:hypothetical protein FSP39_000998 [Pinctada imbricata]|uniref:THAP-type domain-containing protein n=1 Tax=Pinctada imbricata TaxID=66713 RepID=A0AA88XUY4_PINIB|nr:hypothetical protein FSP39_000998 [Pinctada imbricata]
MSKRSCCVKDCSNSWYTLKKWKSQFCETHGINYGTGRCVCDPPFTLIPFPTVAKDGHSRAVWVKNVNRSKGDQNWLPDPYSRICSAHFVDGKPSSSNPYPTVKIGHSNPVTQGRAPPKDRQTVSVTPSKKRKLKKSENSDIHDIDTNELKKILTIISIALTIEHQMEHRRTPSKLEVGPGAREE